MMTFDDWYGVDIKLRGSPRPIARAAWEAGLAEGIRREQEARPRQAPVPAYEGLFPTQRAERLEIEAVRLGLERPTESMIASAINDAVSDVLMWVDGRTYRWHSRYYECAESERNDAALGEE